MLANCYNQTLNQQYDTTRKLLFPKRHPFVLGANWKSEYLEQDKINLEQHKITSNNFNYQKI